MKAKASAALLPPWPPLLALKRKALLYIELGKPKITRTVVMTVLLGYFVALPGAFQASFSEGSHLAGSMFSFWLGLLITLVSASLVCIGACALNHVVEYESDILMQRTKRRPLPLGSLSRRSAIIFSYITAGIGIVIMFVSISWFMALGALCTFLLYDYVYTPMKKRSAWNTSIGSIPGALPVLGGSVAAAELAERNSLLSDALFSGFSSSWMDGFSPAALCVFALLFFWQHPHFYAIAWMYRDDYDKAGYRMIVQGDSRGKKTFGLSFLFTLLCLAVTLILPSFLDDLGWLYYSGSVALGLIFLGFVWRALRNPFSLAARNLLIYSVVYLSLWTLVTIVDVLN